MKILEFTVKETNKDGTLRDFTITEAFFFWFDAVFGILFILGIGANMGAFIISHI